MSALAQLLRSAQQPFYRSLPCRGRCLLRLSHHARQSVWPAQATSDCVSTGTLGGLLAFAAAGIAAGTTGSPAASCNDAPKGCEDPAVRAFVLRLNVVPYGVLGTRLLRDKTINKQAGPMPAAETVILDSGGHHVQPPGSPKRAGGAGKEIYKWVGIAESDSFPPEVTEAVVAVGDAKYHNYDLGRHIIHAWGPDLRKMPDAWEDAVASLADTYGNILHEFAGSGLPALRLLPVSGGIFAGQYSKRMPELTMAALKLGFARLPRAEQVMVVGKRVDLCIFLEAELEEFEAAVRNSCS